MSSIFDNVTIVLVLRQLEFSFHFHVFSRIQCPSCADFVATGICGTDSVELGIFVRNFNKIRFTSHQVGSESLAPTGPGYGHCGLVNGHGLSQAVANDAASRWQTRLDEARVWCAQRMSPTECWHTHLDLWLTHSLYLTTPP